MRRTEAERIGDAARAGLGGLEVEVRVLADDSPARALDRLIESEQPLGLVVGSGHRGAVGRVFLGDVGTSLLSGAACAVAVAPGGYAERAHGRLLRIAVAVNESEESRAALRTGVALAERLNASLTVLTVARPLRYGHAVPFSVVDTGLLADATRERFERILDRALERVPARMPVQRRLLTGDPAASIAAATGDHDLLIVGARGYGPLRRALLGSVSARLARTAGCPLLVLPGRARTIRAGSVSSRPSLVRRRSSDPTLAAPALRLPRGIRTTAARPDRRRRRRRARGRAGASRGRRRCGRARAALAERPLHVQADAGRRALR